MKRTGLVLVVCSAMAFTSVTGEADDLDFMASNQPPELVFEDPGIIRVVRGAQCGKFAGDGVWGNIENLWEGLAENFPCCSFDTSVFAFDVPLTPFPSGEGMITMDGSWTVPEWANRATVILNGWSLAYVDTDHHVFALGATLLPETSGNTIQWTGAATLGDKGMDDEVSACLYYTALAWNSAEIDAEAIAVDPALDNVAPMDHDDSVPFGTGGVEIQYAAGDPELNMAEPVVVLPRGFVLASEFRPVDDDHVFQLGHSTSQVTTLNITSPAAWTATGIIRDNDPDSTFVTSPVTLMRGKGVDVIDNPFAIEDRQPMCTFWTWGGCIGPGTSAGPVHNQSLRERFQVQSDDGYLIPMLTGFDLSFATDDQHLRWATVAIDDITFDVESGVLDYRVSTAMRDKNGNPGFRVKYDVDILVLSRTKSGGPFDHLEIEPESGRQKVITE